MSHDSWVHHIARVAIVRPLMPTPVTPNQLTTVRLVTGIAAAAMVGAGVTPWEHIGAAVFVLSVLLDRADGDLARLTGRTSLGGHKYDLIADTVSNALILCGLGVGLREGGFGLMAVLMGALAGAAVAAILWMVMRMEELKGHRAGELPSFWGFDVDDAVLLILFFGMFRRLLRAPNPD